MDPWELIAKAAKDQRSGSLAITLRAAKGVRLLRSRRDVTRAAGKMLRAHPVMAGLWRLFAVALDDEDVERAVDRYTARLAAGSAAVSDIRWVIGRRPRTVLTHSSSSSVHDAVLASRERIGAVVCTASLPGGEGRTLARRLTAKGIEATVIPDAAIARTCSSVDIAIVGADAVTGSAVFNKVGTKVVALAAREAGVPCYVLAPTAKFVPHRVVDRAADAYEATPLELFDAIVTEQGPKRAAAVRRLAARVSIPQALEAIKL